MYSLVPEKPLRLEFDPPAADYETVQIGLFTSSSKADYDVKNTYYIFRFMRTVFLMTIWAIVDAAQKDFGTAGKKALWWLIASIPFVGFIPYFLFGFRKGKKPNNDG